MKILMKRWFVTVLALVVCSAIVRADVTIVQTTTVEGGAAAASGQNPSSVITTRIKGLKSRTDMELPNGSSSTITDVDAKQVIVLHHDQKTAQMSSPSAVAATPGATVKLDGSATPTGKSRVIDGLKCDEYAFTASMNMSDVTGPNIPPEAAAMMKDLTMRVAGSIWATKEAKGAVEYATYQKAAAAANLSAAALSATGLSLPGMDKMMKAMSSIDGLAYMTEMNMTLEGSGPLADMMRQMGAMTITMKTTSIATDPIADAQFKTPEGYTVVK